MLVYEGFTAVLHERDDTFQFQVNKFLDDLHLYTLK